MQDTALEFVIVDYSTRLYLFDFPSKTRGKVVAKLAYAKPPNIEMSVLRSVTKSPRYLLAQSGITQKWVKGEISNFEYLM